jgi:hypothetical protein
MPMHVTLRPGNTADAQRCGAICYDAFTTIAAQHNFPPDFPSPAVTTELLAGLLAHPGFYAVVAELDGQVSRPGESHPQALSEPDMNVSAHPAPIIQPRV